MNPERVLVKGTVRQGVIVPDGDVCLPEGVTVEIAVSLGDINHDLAEEFEFWERVSNDAWSHIPPWEDEVKAP
jgi:hypothetical protein